MLQQLIALLIILLFVFRLLIQKQRKQISANEFLIWLIFWIIAAILVIFIKFIDQLVAQLGFSASGIQILIYLSVIILFYLILRIRLKMEKIDKDITKIVREIAINKTDNINRPKN